MESQPVAQRGQGIELLDERLTTLQRRLEACELLDLPRIATVLTTTDPGGHVRARHEQRAR